MKCQRKCQIEYQKISKYLSDRKLHTTSNAMPHRFCEYMSASWCHLWNARQDISFLMSDMMPLVGRRPLYICQSQDLRISQVECCRPYVRIIQDICNGFRIKSEVFKRLPDTKISGWGARLPHLGPLTQVSRARSPGYGQCEIHVRLWYGIHMTQPIVPFL